MKNNLKKKIAATITATAMSMSQGAIANAASNYYTDAFGNKVYKDYVIDVQGNKYYEFELDHNGNALILDNDYGYNNRYDDDYYYDDYESNGHWFSNDEYNGRNNSEPHINVDIDDPEVLERFLNQHAQNCDEYPDYYDKQDYINHGNANYSDQNNWNNQNTWENNLPNNNTQVVNTLYTAYKNVNGVERYAYTPVTNLDYYNIYGWTIISTYNSNDYNLNSIFYEEINTYGNDICYNPVVKNRLDNINSLYVWRYETTEGTKYCVSPVKYPTNSMFTYNSNFNSNDVAADLKTAEAIVNGYTNNNVNSTPESPESSWNNIPQNNIVPSTNEQVVSQLYTVYKEVNGIKRYAYSPVPNLETFDIFGWNVISVYNSNHYDLNSVFYEEITTYGNDIRYNPIIKNKLDNIHNLFIWKYETAEGTKYCVSPVKYPTNSMFTYNSDFNSNDVAADLKTAESIEAKVSYILTKIR